jgi:hypothetical protein
VFRCRVAVSLWLLFVGGDGGGLIFGRVPLPGCGPASVGLVGVKIKMDANSVCG